MGGLKLDFTKLEKSYNIFQQFVYINEKIKT